MQTTCCTRRKEVEVATLKRKDEAAASEAAVDLGPLGDSVGYLLRRAQVTVFQRFFQLFAEVDIRPVQYSILTVIERNPGLSQMQLAGTLGIKKTNLVALIDELEARGLARRKSAEIDRRARALYLTPRGNTLIARLHRMDGALDKRISRLMGNDRQRLCEILRQIASL